MASRVSVAVTGSGGRIQGYFLQRSRVAGVLLEPNDKPREL